MQNSPHFRSGLRKQPDFPPRSDPVGHLRSKYQELRSRLRKKVDRLRRTSLLRNRLPFLYALARDNEAWGDQGLPGKAGSDDHRGDVGTILCKTIL